MFCHFSSITGTLVCVLHGNQTHYFAIAFLNQLRMLSHLPKNSETIPTENEDNMPPMEKMATESDHRDVSVC